MATRKIYTSGYSIGVNVVLEGGVSRHVSFTDKTSGSYLVTDDEKLQEALEKHPRFGVLFRLAETHTDKPAAKKNTDTPADAPEDVPEDVPEDAPEDTPEDNGMKVVKVSCPDDAKDYLADTFGVMRSQMKSIKRIKEEGEKHGILFEGI